MSRTNNINPGTRIHANTPPDIFFIYLFSFATRAGSPQQREPITVGPYYLTHPVNFPCGRKPEYPEKTHDFRQSVDYALFTLFNGYFHSVYTNFSDKCASLRFVSSPPLPNISCVELSPEEGYLTLQNLNPTKAHGPDGFPSCVLKECAFQLAPSLRYLFNKSLRLSQIPTEWKLANVIPYIRKARKITLKTTVLFPS